MKKLFLFLLMFSIFQNSLLYSFIQEKNGIQLRIKQAFNQPLDRIIIHEPETISTSHLTHNGFYSFNITLTNKSDKSVFIAPSSFKHIELGDYEKIGKQIFTTNQKITSCIAIFGLLTMVYAIPIMIGLEAQLQHFFSQNKFNDNLHVVFLTGLASFIGGSLGIIFLDDSKRLVRKLGQESILNPIVVKSGGQISKLIYLSKENCSKEGFIVDLLCENSDEKIQFYVDFDSVL